MPNDVAKAVSPELSRLGEEVLEPRVFDWVTDAERNQPYVSGGEKDAFGKPTSSRLVVAEGWKRLQELGFEKGYVRTPPCRKILPRDQYACIDLRLTIIENGGPRL